MDRKEFLGVVFNDKSNSIVPQLWIVHSGNRADCWWPARNVDRKSKGKMVPDKETWTKHHCTIIAGASTYERCAQKVYATSFVESTSESARETHDRPQNISFTSREPLRTSREPLRELERPCCCNELRNDFRTVVRKLEKLTQNINSRDQERIVTEEREAIPMLGAPATTTDELDQLAFHPQLIPMLKPCVGANTGDTIRRILKRTMTRDLAVQYSYSGLGARRQKNKLIFGEHLLCSRILDNTQELSITDDRSATIDKIKASLRGARDWRGGRQHTAMATARASAQTQLIDPPLTASLEEQSD